MSLKKASDAVPNEDWLQWDELASENAAVVCTVKSIEAPRDYGNGEVAAVRADVIVLTGKRAGEQYPAERILKAGIRSKLKEVGDSVVGRVGVYGARRAIGLEAERDGDVALAEQALAKFGASGHGNGERNQANAAAKAANVGSDEDPPF